MDRTWLVYDVNYLAWRAYHTTGDLSHEGGATGVIYGLLRDFRNLAEEFATPHAVFCFDHGKGLREQRCPWYKETRRKRKLEEGELASEEDLRRQIELLRQVYLGDLGYENVLAKTGYEADDLMATVTAGLPEGDRAILVTGDQDLYQLLSRTAAVYHPKQKVLITAKALKAEMRVHPRDWTQVKAIAGCVSDDISGCEGVGPATAIKYLAGELPKHYKAYKAIQEFLRLPEYQINLELVTLPYMNALKPYTPVEDPPRDVRAWNELVDRLGMKSLLMSEEGDRVVRYG